MSSKRPIAPPPHIPGFTYISLLGSGGFSDVYLYEQDRPRRKVAVKVLLSDLKTEGARRRFESEANLMAQLSSHPYIVTIFEAEITTPSIAASERRPVTANSRPMMITTAHAGAS